MTRKLHLGGQQAAEGWEILDAIEGPDVDHLGDARDLSRFKDGEFSEIYASHIIEHLDYKDEIGIALKEWNRVLEPGGILYISAPDLDVLARLFINKQLDVQARFFVMQMMFGGHIDKYDYHVVGLTAEFLYSFLSKAGFNEIKKVKSFDLFEDTSNLLFGGVPISVNLIAKKPVS